MINLLCDRALLGTYVQGKSLVNLPTLNKAAREVFGEPGDCVQMKKNIQLGNNQPVAYCLRDGPGSNLL